MGWQALALVRCGVWEYDRGYIFTTEGSRLMRNLQTLDQAGVDTSTGVISFSAAGESVLNPTVAMRREGDYAAISASYGAIELALRLKIQELARTVKQLQPNDGLGTTRQVGSGDSFLGLGARTDGALILRPTIVGDASGYFCLNLMLTSEAAGTLRTWLEAVDGKA